MDTLNDRFKELGNHLGDLFSKEGATAALDTTKKFWQDRAADIKEYYDSKGLEQTRQEWAQWASDVEKKLENVAATRKDEAAKFIKDLNQFIHEEYQKRAQEAAARTEQ